MPRHSYRERDYAFGQAMFKLRTSIGLNQAGLAKQLGVSRRAIGEWEAGSTYPKAEHLQHFIELCVQQHVFTAGREEEEIRTLWKTAHQRVLLDEAWLSALLTRLLPYQLQSKSPVELLLWGRLLLRPSSFPFRPRRRLSRLSRSRSPPLAWTGWERST